MMRRESRFQNREKIPAIVERQRKGIDIEEEGKKQNSSERARIMHNKLCWAGEKKERGKTQAQGRREKQRAWYAEQMDQMTYKDGRL